MVFQSSDNVLCLRLTPQKQTPRQKAMWELLKRKSSQENWWGSEKMGPGKKEAKLWCNAKFTEGQLAPSLGELWG